MRKSFLRLFFVAQICCFVFLNISCNHFNSNSSAMREFLIDQIRPDQPNYLNSELAIEYGHVFDGMRGYGSTLQDNPWQVKDINNPEIISINNGTALFNGRRIPAGIIQARIEMINRSAGTKKTNFIAIAALHDVEFKMWRGIVVVTKEEDVPNMIAGWGKYWSFK